MRRQTLRCAPNLMRTCWKNKCKAPPTTRHKARMHALPGGSLGPLLGGSAQQPQPESCGADSFAGLPWDSPSPAQVTTMLSEGAQNTSSPASCGHCRGSGSAPEQANSLTPGATVPQPLPLTGGRYATLTHATDGGTCCLEAGPELKMNVRNWAGAGG